MLGHYLIIATAGHDTTSNTISGGLLALLEHPDQLDLLRSEPELIDHAADELIRYVSPVRHFMRTCHEPFQLGDVTIGPGEMVYLSYASANRDEEVFADPFEFDITRDPNPHLTFGGGGPHFCLGANLARLEMRILFEELTARADAIELVGPVGKLRSNFIHGIKTLPIRLS
jgi:cytochrome P450